MTISINRESKIFINPASKIPEKTGQWRFAGEYKIEKKIVIRRIEGLKFGRKSVPAALPGYQAYQT